MDDPGRGGGGGRGGVVERGDVRKGFAPSSTINQNQTAASEAALLSDATLDAGAARAFGYMPTMTSASGLGSINNLHGSLSAEPTSASGLGLNNPLHGSLSASTTFASGPGTNNLLLNEANLSLGIRINKQPPNTVFRKKDKGGISITNTVPLTHTDHEEIKAVMGEYKISSADIAIRCVWRHIQASLLSIRITSRPPPFP